jgi:hypothetical protein
VIVDTHVKYLLDPERDDRIALTHEGTFQVKSAPMLEGYGPGALSKIKMAADLFSGMEKQGVHAVTRMSST